MAEPATVLPAKSDSDPMFCLQSYRGFNFFRIGLLSDFINLTQVHNFTVSAQDIFTFSRLSVFTVSFTGISQLLMQIIKPFVPSY